MISRNGPCPCGSNKKYKRCCGKEGCDKGGSKNPMNSFNTLDILQTVAALTLMPGNHGNNLHPHFKSNCSHAAHALLLISDTMLRKAGCVRYMFGRREGLRISVSSPGKLNMLKQAVFFSTEDIDTLFAPFQIAKDCLKLFV